MSPDLSKALDEYAAAVNGPRNLGQGYGALVTSTSFTTGWFLPMSLDWSRHTAHAHMVAAIEYIDMLKDNQCRLKEIIQG